MATEIIKTEDSNVVIERTIIDREINVSELISEKESIETMINSFSDRIEKLNQTTISPEFQYLIDEEINKLEIKINETYAGVALINLMLNQI